MSAFAEAQLKLAACDVALDGGEMSDSFFTPGRLDALNASLSDLDTLVVDIGEALLNQSIFVLPVILDEYVYTGEFCTTHVIPREQHCFPLPSVCVRIWPLS